MKRAGVAREGRVWALTLMHLLGVKPTFRKFGSQREQRRSGRDFNKLVANLSDDNFA